MVLVLVARAQLLPLPLLCAREHHGPEKRNDHVRAVEERSDDAEQRLRDARELPAVSKRAVIEPAHDHPQQRRNRQRSLRLGVCRELPSSARNTSSGSVESGIQ